MGDAPAHPGQRFDIQERLGSGGMGVVYRARDTEQGIDVALKRLGHNDPTAVARFKREFRVLADIVHPNLVQLYELIASGEELFFTMELVTGLDFIKWVRPKDPAPTLPSRTTLSSRRGAPATGTTTTATTTAVEPGPRPTRSPDKPVAVNGVDVGRLRRAGAQLARGIAAIHEAGLLHRDLKPSNVLVTRKGRVVVLDFGIATDRTQEITVTAMDDRVVGTPHYMAPEQAAGKPSTPASDWYAFGAMLYVALTNRMPYDGSRAEVMRDKQRFAPPPPHLASPDAPNDLVELCIDLMKIDPEKRPSGEDVLARLGVRGADALTLSRKRSVSAEHRRLVGRKEQVTALERAFADSCTGRTVLANVSGRSGMGKTALLRTALRRFRRDGAVVLRGRCYQRESVPFKALDSLVDALSTRLQRYDAHELEEVIPEQVWSLTRMFPVLRRVESFDGVDFLDSINADAQELRRRAFAAMRDLLRRMSEREHLILAIDDLQWGDRDSAELLAELIRPPHAPALLLVASYRNEDQASSEFLREFAQRCRDNGVDTRNVEVGPLDRDAACELALQHIGEGDVGKALADRIAEESRGSPFFVEELARYAAEQTNPSSSDVLSLQDVLQSRLLRLPAPARRLLTTVAVAARPIPERVATRAAQVDDPGALQLLTAGAFVIAKTTDAGRYLETYHDRLREAATTMLTPEETRAHHARLANLLEAEPNADPEELAQYLHGAGEDTRAARFAARAAEDAATTLAFDRAARLYQWALELAPLADDRRAMMVALGDALLNARRGTEAAEMYLAAAEGAPPARYLDLRRRASHQLLNAGHIDRGREILDEVLATFDMRLPKTKARGIASLLWHRMRLSLRGLRFVERSAEEVGEDALLRLDSIYAAAEGLGMIQPISGACAQARHLGMALDAGERWRIAQALAAEIAFVSRAGTHAQRRTARAQKLLDEIAAGSDDPFMQARSHGAATLAKFQEGEFLSAHEHGEITIRLLEDECVGVQFEIGTLESFRVMIKMALGRLRETVALVDKRAGEALDRDDLFTATNIAACGGFWRGLIADDPERAHQEIAEAIEMWRAEGFHLQHMQAINSHTLIDNYAGNGVRALERLDKALPDYKKAYLMTAQIVRANVYSWHGRAALTAALTAGDPKPYLATARKDARRLAREGVRYGDMYDVALRAGLARLRGNDDTALALLGETERIANEIGMMWFAWASSRMRGLMLGGSEGEQLVARADAAFSEEGVRNPARMAAFVIPGFWKPG